MYQIFMGQMWVHILTTLFLIWLVLVLGFVDQGVLLPGYIYHASFLPLLFCYNCELRSSSMLCSVVPAVWSGCSSLFVDLSVVLLAIGIRRVCAARLVFLWCCFVGTAGSIWFGAFLLLGLSCQVLKNYFDINPLLSIWVISVFITFYVYFYLLSVS